MIDPVTRRDVVGHLLAAGTATQLPGTVQNDSRCSSTGTTLGSNIEVIGLFKDISRPCLRADCAFVGTTGHSRIGQGAASYAYDTAVDARYVASHRRTAFIDANGRGFRLSEQSPDVLQAGAIGDGSVDDTAACQEALNIVESAGGGIVILPVGSYKITAPLKLPPHVSLQGYGQSSVLHVNGCDGIAISKSDVIGPRRVSNFTILGSSCERASAITCDLDDADRAQGIVFENLYLSFFGIGVNSRGFWHTTFRTVSMHQVWRGFHLRGRNVKITIDDCRITQGDLLKGDGLSVGIQVGDEVTKFRPEDVQVSKTIIFGFNKAIVWRQALFGGVVSCDLDACSNTGLELVTADGGFTFRDNWVQVDGTNVRGIDCTALGYEPQLTNILISNNRINSNKASSGSCGILVGNQQSDIVIDSNSISGRWESGIQASGARRLGLHKNKVAGNITLERCADVTVAHNFAGGGMSLTANTGLVTDVGFGPHSAKIVGGIIILAGQTNQTASFRSLNLPDLPEGMYRVSLVLANISGQPRGEIRGEVTRTGISVQVERSSPRSGDISFQIGAY
ncbi:right-handed parallel beta-helix repeat-containing protein [Sphingomonas faeni]|uniref:right-handed parallel beta-helix repeat-containing protein n=1 Tax=Sphingomonas faeni TaxID=185950 RepID=UPI0027891DDE|nr:right-handed parallel beta-helix repeat-containing protein [Sphingomonas faeni]MDQ0839832.1 hypothetical protein [Sphingomonas faeni]